MKNMNKKGQEGAIVAVIFIALLFVLLVVGFLIAVGSAVINWTFDEAVPELTGLGTVGSTNLTEIAGYTLTPLNSFVQSWTWLTGIIYVMLIVGSFGLLLVFRVTGSRWLIGFYIALMLFLILGSMFMSNIYEEFYTGTDDLAVRLQEHGVLSFFILYSPMIFSIIGFIFGALLFSGIGQEENYV